MSNVAYSNSYDRSLNPRPGSDLKQALLAELREYVHLPCSDDELLERCMKAPQDILDEWKGRKIDPKNDAAVTGFYVDTKLYCYELIGLEITAPLARQEQLEGFVKLLKSGQKLVGCDMGSGIGTLGLYLNANGITCDFADVSETNLRFIEQRLKARSLTQPKCINLMKNKIAAGQYDFITAFDVLEHVSDPLALIDEISSKLRPGGYFIFNLLYDNHPDTPHILMDPNPIRKNIRGYGLKKLGALGEFKIYQKVARPQALNSMIRAADTAFWNFRTWIR